MIANDTKPVKRYQNTTPDSFFRTSEHKNGSRKFSTRVRDMREAVRRSMSLTRGGQEVARRMVAAGGHWVFG